MTFPRQRANVLIIADFGLHRFDAPNNSMAASQTDSAHQELTAEDKWLWATSHNQHAVTESVQLLFQAEHSE